MSEGTGRHDIEQRLIQRSLEDDVFRQQLLADPRAIIERELGTPLPEKIRVVAVEESADTIYLVLPSASTPGEGAELSDRELEAVAGGGWAADTVNDATCNPAGYTCGACYTTDISCPD